MRVLILSTLFCFSTADFSPDDFQSASKSCPLDYANPPLILMSMDGFRADYLDRGLTPTIEALAQMGVSSPFMKPSYPAVTFSNHYTLVTGLLPAYHGIVANKFYDPIFDETFKVGRAQFDDPKFWLGEPIWKTVENQGKIAATYFWPGSEVKTMTPSIWLSYNESHPFSSRVEKVLEWIDLPASERPNFMTLYMHEPDRQGHNFGPNSAQTNMTLREVDGILALLLEGLKDRNLLNCVNLVVLADHGMAEAGEERLIRVQNLIPNINTTTRFWDGVFPRFEPLSGSKEEAQLMMEDLSCKNKAMRVYEKSFSPIRWHLDSHRIEDVVLDLDAGYSADFDETYETDKGDHGYDYIFKSMNALFAAHGPAFKKGIEVESFQNIEIYNLLCAVMDLEPAPNNGTWGALHHMLANPPIIPNLQPNPKFPPIAKVPYKKYGESSEEDSDEEKGSFSREWWKVGRNLMKAVENKYNLLHKHTPWGIPQTRTDQYDVTLLLHQDHITGFSLKTGLALWVSFTVHRTYRSRNIRNWMTDYRLEAQDQSNPGKDNLDNYYTYTPLFNPVFSDSGRTSQIPFLNSNAVPISSYLLPKWNYLNNLIDHWKKTYKEINVVLGTVYDFNRDTLVDDLSTFNRNSDEPTVPTHFFAVITRCYGGGKLRYCPHNYLDTLAFVFPQDLAVDNCLTDEEFAREFSAKVNDVEKITGLSFYYYMSQEDRIRQQIRIHSNIWEKESYYNRQRTDTYKLKK